MNGLGRLAIGEWYSNCSGQSGICGFVTRLGVTGPVILPHCLSTHQLVEVAAFQ